MKAIEPRSLLSDKIKEVIPNEEFQELFRYWKQLMRESNKDTTEFDCFFAGYVFANPMVKDMYRKAKGKDINKYDERISGLRKK